jgi:peptidoglycan hydrolase-like protein with peptidoglycan-binding domain
MVLKKGSKGKEVKELQEFLQIKDDGDFGLGTETAVINWQKNHGLIGDGIVGPKTWDEMGLATTDNSEMFYTTESGLKIVKHYLPKGEYKSGPTDKEFLFLHHTAGWHNPYKVIDQWGNDTRGSIATEFVMGGPSVKGGDTKYDGELLQAFPEGGYGWHLGKNGSQHTHTHSVGIEVCNFGYIKDGKTYAGTKVDPSQIVTLPKPFRGYKDWHRYSDKQIQTLKDFIIFIADRDGVDVRSGLVSEIKKNGVGGFDFNENAYYGKVKGMWTHTNTRKDKFDMFPQPELIDMLLSL